jgi:hypothetical protein
MTTVRTCLSMAVPLLLLASPGCSPEAPFHGGGRSNVMTSQLVADLDVARKGRILFSHHSVGRNVLDGIARIDGAASGPARLRILSAEEAARTPGPALIEVSGGRNGEPESKIDFFVSVVRSTPRLMPQLAFMKLCYVDFDPRTDVETLFGRYRSALEGLKREHAEIQFAHVTVPLVARPMESKWRLYRLIGREVWEDAANAKRADYNRRLLETFGADPVFDLALTEATAPDGRLTTFRYGGQDVPSLFPGFSEDGGHLNVAGQEAAGVAAIRFLAQGLGRVAGR